MLNAVSTIQLELYSINRSTQPKRGNMVNELLKWFTQNKRDMPWRNTTDPYKIWISEIMLQQTQVSTVIPYYNRFISHYPTVQSLANANVDGLFKLWEGLGYYSRARRLIPCAKLIVDQHAGKFPKDYQQALALPGIGSYTAGAILSIAYGVKRPAVDGNVLRLVSRLYGDDGDIAKAATKKRFEAILKPLIPRRAGDFNQALIELGSVVCKPQKPDCQVCPLKCECVAYADNRIDELPVKSKKKPSPTVAVDVAVIAYNGRYLMYQKSDQGLLGGFWTFPISAKTDIALADWVADNYDFKLVNGHYLGTVKHVFTHKTWQMSVYYYTSEQPYAADNGQGRWVSIDEMSSLAISTAIKKVVKLIVQKLPDTTASKRV